MPQSASSTSTSSRQRIEFRYQTGSRTALGQTYRYLLKNPRWHMEDGKTKANSAILAFWYTLALLERGEPESTVRDVAITSILQLESQAEFLRQKVGLSGKMMPVQPAVQPAQSVWVESVAAPTATLPALPPTPPALIPIAQEQPSPEPAQNTKTTSVAPVSTANTANTATRIPGMIPSDMDLEALLFDDE